MNVVLAIVIIALISILIILVAWVYVDGTAHNFLRGHPEIFAVYEKFKLLHSTEAKKRTLPSNPRIALVSLSIGRRRFAELSREALASYASRHGYDLHYFTETIDDDYHIMWQKVIAMRKILRDYDAVVWLDDDIYITNPTIKIESFMEEARTDVILSYDPVSKKSPHNYINGGFFIVMNTKRGNKFMDEVLAGYDKFNGKYSTDYCHEQSIINYLYYEKYYRYCTILPMQSHRRGPFAWKEGDFCLHLCGASEKYRYDAFSKFRETNEILVA